MFCICGFTELIVPGFIETVADGMFSDCGELRSVTISDSVKTVGSGAFEWCLKLTEVTVPESVTLIQSNAFYNCPLANVYYAGTVEQWRGVFTPAEIRTSDNIYTCTVHCKDGTLTFDYYFNPYEGIQ